MARVSIFNGVRDRRGVEVNIETVIDRIRSGAKGLDEKTRYCNIIAQTDPETYKKYKTTLPAVTWSGTFRKRTELIQHSGHVVVDYDGVDIGSLLAELAQHPQVAFAFVSPSGEGGKAVTRVTPVPTTAQEHKHAFAAVSDVLGEFGEIDPSGSDVTRLCFLAHDPRPIINPNATPVAWETPDEPEQTHKPVTDTQFTGKADLKALDHIPADNYNTWYQVGLALYRAGHSIDVWIEWSEKSEKAAGNTAEMYAQKWRSFAHTRDTEKQITWGSVVHLAKQNGYNPNRNHKPIKLTKSDIACVTEPIEKARQAIREAFDGKARFIGFRADTGIGKTHETITLYQLKGIGGFFSTPTSDLAKEVEARLDIAEVDVFRWRGLHAEQDGQFPHEKPCMYPDEYTAYSESGRNAYEMLCTSCQYLHECETDGYRSQESKAKAAQVTVAAHKDLLMNPLFRNTANRLLPSGKDDLIVIDEFNVFESFIKIEVTQARLEYLRDTWKDHPLRDFAIDLLHACVIQNAPHTGIASVLDYLSDHPTKQQAIIEGLASYRVNDTIYSRKEVHYIESHKQLDIESIKALPKIETPDWNLLVQLEVFIDAYRHPVGAPIEWKDGKLTFHLPPLPFYTQSKVLCMSATLNQHFFERVFRHRQAKRKDVGFIDAADTEWHPDARVYQLRTNRNPRKTLLTREKRKDDKTGKEKWHWTGLTATGQEALDQTLTYAKAHPDRQHVLISFQWLIETYSKTLEAANIITGYFGNLVGLDQHFQRDSDDGIVLHIIGAPEIPPSKTEHHYHLLYGDRETPPDFTRDETTGEYRDRDAQAIYDADVKSETMQGIGRAGLVKNPSLVILRTSHELPSVTHREQTLLFDEADETDNLDELASNIRTREAQEQAEAEALDKGDVQAYTEASGYSERTGRRKTKAVRDQKKADRDDAIIRLHQQGHSQREIERQLKGTEYQASRKAINSVIVKWCKTDSLKRVRTYSVSEMHHPHEKAGEACDKPDTAPVEVKAQRNIYRDLLNNKVISQLDTTDPNSPLHAFNPKLVLMMVKHQRCYAERNHSEPLTAESIRKINNLLTPF